MSTSRLDAWREYVDAKIDELDQEIEKLQAEKRVLKRLRNDPPASLFDEDVAASKGTVVPRPGEQPPTPSEGVDALVRENPGLTRKEIMDELENEVASDAKNVRASISSAVGRRLKDGDFVQDGRGRIWPREHERGQEALEQTEMEEMD